MTQKQKYEYLIKELKILKMQCNERFEYWNDKVKLSDAPMLSARAKAETYQAVSEYIKEILNAVG